MFLLRVSAPDVPVMVTVKVVWVVCGVTVGVVVPVLDSDVGEPPPHPEYSTNSIRANRASRTVRFRERTTPTNPASNPNVAQFHRAGLRKCPVTAEEVELDTFVVIVITA